MALPLTRPICPKCLSNEYLLVAIESIVELLEDGTLGEHREANGYAEDSDARCDFCGWEGLVKDLEE